MYTNVWLYLLEYTSACTYTYIHNDMLMITTTTIISVNFFRIGNTNLNYSLYIYIRLV